MFKASNWRKARADRQIGKGAIGRVVTTVSLLV